MIYRDTETGKFVSKATWKRSRAHGGTRYRRSRTGPVKKHPKIAKAVRAAALPEPEERYEEEEEIEYGGAFDSP